MPSEWWIAADKVCAQVGGRVKYGFERETATGGEAEAARRAALKAERNCRSLKPKS